MGVEYNPDARQGPRARIGPEILQLPFSNVGDVNCAAANGAIVSRLLFEEGWVGVIALGCKSRLGNLIGLHMCVDAKDARSMGASLIDLANQLDDATGDVSPHVQ